MKSIVCNAPGQLELVERPEPVLAKGQSIIRVRRVGICGTDFHIFQGRHPYLQYPRVMGHEFSGIVFQTSDPARFSEGQAVIVNPYISCGKCLACRKSKPNCCANISVLGVHVDGALQEFIPVPNEALIAAEGITPNQAASVEFLAVGTHAVRRAGVQSGDNVLVAGAGPIGLGTALICRLSGARVTLLDLNESRLAAASSMLAFESTVVANSETGALLADMTNGEFFDTVFDATGNTNSIHSSFEYVGHGGTLCLISVVKDDITFSDPVFHAREMQIIGSRNATNKDFNSVIGYMRNGDLPVDKLLTHTVDLADLPSVFETLPDTDRTLIKAIVAV